MIHVWGDLSLFCSSRFTIEYLRPVESPRTCLRSKCLYPSHPNGTFDGPSIRPLRLRSVPSSGSSVLRIRLITIELDLSINNHGYHWKKARDTTRSISTLSGVLLLWVIMTREKDFWHRPDLPAFCFLDMFFFLMIDLYYYTLSPMPFYDLVFSLLR